MMKTDKTHLLQVLVTVDVLALVAVLQLVCLNVLPEGRDDDRAGLCVHPQQACQPGIKLELVGLVVKQQKDGAPHVFVTWPLHL